MNIQPSASIAFENFRKRVFEDPTLQARLRAIDAIDVFVEQAVAIGAEVGYTFSSSDVRAALKTGQTTWLVTGSPIL